MGSVPQIELHRRKLSAAFKRAQALAGNQTLDELQADYARHLCVLVSGFIERSVAEIVLAYAHSRTPPPIRSFLESSLRRLTNVDKDRLLTVVGSLDASWRTQLEAYVVDERQAAINSVVGLRNDIAHGGGGSVSLRQMQQYWLVVQEVIDKVEELLLTPPQGRRQR